MRQEDESGTNATYRKSSEKTNGTCTRNQSGTTGRGKGQGGGRGRRDGSGGGKGRGGGGLIY